MINNSNEVDAVLVGITGAMSSGKSSVSEIIRNQGYSVIDSDALAKDFLANDPKVRLSIEKLLGEDAYIEDKPNLVFISQKVFADEKLIEGINKIIHPLVFDAIYELNQELAQKGERLIFTESALMFETGLDEGFDYIVDVYCSSDIAKNRAISKGFSADDFDKRSSMQLSPEQKKGLADFVIDNSKDLKNLENSTLFTLEILKSLPNNAEKFKDNE